MRLATRENIYAIDRRAAEDFGLPASALIERAGRALADAFSKYIPAADVSGQRIALWCGRGNNGADGRVMALHLRAAGLNVTVVEDVSWDIEKYDVIIDAYFGVGLNRPVEGPVLQQILKINAAEKYVVAVDVPSGLDANRGVALGAALKARWTLTVAPAKPGLFFQEGPGLAGKVRTVDLDFPPELLKQEANEVFLIGAASARKILPLRNETSNKTHFGHLLVIAGSRGMEGAALLAAEAAARMGCGYVTVCSESSELYQRVRPDFLHLSLKDFFRSDLEKYSAVVCGPGLGRGPQVEKILAHLVRTKVSRVLVDADALSVLAQGKKCPLPGTWILTPHAGELSRLTGILASDLEKDRLRAVKEGQSQWGCGILFKGFRTVLGFEQKAYIIGSGNVALAKAGTGDILSGFIGSLMAQNLPSEQAAALGAYLHGRIADDWLRAGHSNRSLMASDLPELLDLSLRRLIKAR